MTVRAVAGLLAILVAWVVPAAGQQPPDRPDSARAQIHTVLRAFYFSLAHQDWEALTAHILPAKVLAHRPPPEALILAAASTERATPAPAVREQVCSSEKPALVERASITLDGDWAEVSVPRCAPAEGAVDEFRLVHFETRWRLVYIDLFQEPVSISSGR